MSPYPAYAPDQLLPALRDYLTAQSLGRKPADATADPTLPPIWLDPKRGIPYPGEKRDNAVEQHPDLVLALYPATGVPSVPFEGFLVKLGVAIWYRAKLSPTAQTHHEKIRGMLHDKRDLNFNGLSVNQSQMTREIQRISSDERGYVYNCEYMFDLWNANYVFQ